MPQDSPRGTYLQVAESIRTRIVEDPHLVDLPPVSRLMEDHGVSRSLVTRALKSLQRDGVVTSIQGAGWRVVRSEDDARPLVDRIRAVFAEDSLGIGDTFPSEAQLCARFGRSRTAIRSALAELEGTGLLERVPGKPRTVRVVPEEQTGP
ncbi:GntR family transcriptional regulator [Streptomyces sp. MP131-18]|uniref:GntR family transcriptional regulator n=1 Tax=Streptomyces sp. MP131-18 TaxID=1857892 RepID=UPI00097BD4DB|nr:GntR family transcriptional regulator [Streptomyces sp. MP131-18]ONK13118.1 DNA-binding transcriptional repressor MngR [Streptomyces sp. MP131-18]